LNLEEVQLELSSNYNYIAKIESQGGRCGPERVQEGIQRYLYENAESMDTQVRTVTKIRLAKRMATRTIYSKEIATTAKMDTKSTSAAR
jgi:hypothetical protein